MSSGSAALRALIDIEQRVQREEACAEALGRLAGDCARWGLVEEAERLRSRGRSHRVACLQLGAQAAAWVLRPGGPGAPAGSP